MRKIVAARMEISGTGCFICALQEDNVVQDLLLTAGGPFRRSVLGNIYVAEVENISNNMQLAFVRFSPDQRCCIRLSETDDLIYVNPKNPETPLKPGDQVLIRITKEAMKGKQASGSAELSVAGRYLAVSSKGHGIGVSRKLDPETRERLKGLLSSQGTFPYSVVIRTNAADASPEAVIEEAEELQTVLNRIIRQGIHRSLYSCLYSPPDPVLVFVRDMWKPGTEIVTDEPFCFDQIREILSVNPGLQTGDVPLRLYSDKLLPLYNLYNLKSVLDEATHERVWLKSGGCIVIQPAEACTVIDVNTGKNIRRQETEKAFLDTNLEAAREIARQMRIRSLSGIILVDFINLKDVHDREILMETMKNLLRNDPDGAQVIDMTALQIMEITRKKTRPPLKEIISALYKS